MITYIKDDNNKHYDTLLKGILAYNDSITGATTYGPYNIYVLDKGHLVGAIHASYDWNWADINEVFYDSDEILDIMLDALNHEYHDKLQGIGYGGHNPLHIQALLERGYKTNFTITKWVEKYDYMDLINDTMILKVNKHNFTLIRTKNILNTYKTSVTKAHNKFDKIHDIVEKEDSIQLVALDDKQCVGGINGSFIDNRLYISILWVKESYRGQSIASNLMTRLLDICKEKKITYSWLGTTNFQAKDFYEQFGYKIQATVEECPKGYKNYVMVKEDF